MGDQSNGGFSTTIYVNSQIDGGEAIYSNCSVVSNTVNSPSPYASGCSSTSSSTSLTQTSNDQATRVPPPIKPRTSVLRKGLQPISTIRSQSSDTQSTVQSPTTIQPNSLQNTNQNLNNELSKNELPSKEVYTVKKDQASNEDSSEVDDGYYDEPIKHFKPPSFPPPPPPSQQSSSNTVLNPLDKVVPPVSSSNSNKHHYYVPLGAEQSEQDEAYSPLIEEESDIDASDTSDNDFSTERTTSIEFSRIDSQLQAQLNQLDQKLNELSANEADLYKPDAEPTYGKVQHCKAQRKTIPIPQLPPPVPPRVNLSKPSTPAPAECESTTSTLSSGSAKPRTKIPMVGIIQPLVRSLSRNSFSLDRYKPDKSGKCEKVNKLENEDSSSSDKNSKLSDEDEVCAKEKQGFNAIRAHSEQGFLFKTGPKRKQFYRRWCQLDDQSLSYYHEQPSKDGKRCNPSGQVHLNDVLFIGKQIAPVTLRTSGLSRALQTMRQGLGGGNGGQSNTDGSENQLELHPFNVGVSNASGRCYLFAVESEAVRRRWLKALTLHIRPRLRPAAISYDNVDACGYLNLKLGVSGLWTRCWAVLSGRLFTLQMLELPEPQVANDCLDVTVHSLLEVDLRKVSGVEEARGDRVEACPSATEPGNVFVLSRHAQHSLYLQADYRMHTQCWCSLLQSHWILPENGGLEAQLLSASDVPLAVEKCLNFVCTYGGLSTAGLYAGDSQQSGEASAIMTIFNQLKGGCSLFEWHLKPEDGYTVFDVVDALKMYLSSFPECILTEQLYAEFIRLANAETNEQLEQLYFLVERLPHVHRCTLRKLLGHFACVLEQQPHTDEQTTALCAAMAPMIIYSNISASVQPRLATQLLRTLLRHYTWLFHVSSDELAKERKIQQTLLALRQARPLHTNTSNSPRGSGNGHTGQQMLVGVYLHDREHGRCVNVPISSAMNADDLLVYVIKLAQLPDTPTTLTVFEVVAREQLQRWLHYSESILEVTLGWATRWPTEDAKHNYLLVRANPPLLQQLAPHFSCTDARHSTIPLSLFSELRYSGDAQGKHFRKVMCELLGARCNVYKDAKASRTLASWELVDTVWYEGCEVKRAPPTKHCITFVPRNETIERSKDTHGFIGRVIACASQEELHRWMAALITAQHPNGVQPLIHSINLLD